MLEAIELELHILEHLYAALPRENWQQTLDYRPSPEQRSVLDLLRYLSYAGIGGCLAAVEGGFEGFRRVAKRAEDMSADEFPAAMACQRQEIAEVSTATDRPQGLIPRIGDADPPNFLGSGQID